MYILNIVILILILFFAIFLIIYGTNISNKWLTFCSFYVIILSI